MEVSRLLVGHNPVCGNSHASETMSADMTAYFGQENVVAMYRHAERLGLRTLVVRGDYERLGHLEMYRRTGGAMNVICQTASEMHDVYRNIRVCAAAGAEGIYHHGTQTDRFWYDGHIDRVKDYLACMRDCGVAVGLCSHRPEVIDYARDRAWDVDFYMCCFYDPGGGRKRESAVVARSSAGRSGEAFEEELYDAADRDRMCRTILAVDKPVLAFKILAATRNCATQADVRDAYRYAYSHIKPTDAVAVGFFPKYQDQISLGIRYAREACGAPAAEV
jgi:hypothetical protein